MRALHTIGSHWSFLALILLLVMGGLVLEHSLPLPSLGHKITLLLIIVLAYGLMGWWANSHATDTYDIE